MIAKELLDILVCPKCKGPVTLSQNKTELVCGACMLAYEIRDGIPIMLSEEARDIGEQASQVLHRSGAD